MQCPMCSRKLTESDWLLCSVPGGHYCPHCWAEISSEGELFPPVSSRGADENRQSNSNMSADKPRS
jgi:hypothetical protein